MDMCGKECDSYAISEKGASLIRSILLELSLCLDEIEFLHEAGPAIGHHDGHILHEGFAIVDQRIQKQLVVLIQDRVGFDEFVHEDEVRGRVDVLVFLEEVFVERRLRLFVIQ